MKKLFLTFALSLVAFAASWAITPAQIEGTWASSEYPFPEAEEIEEMGGSFTALSSFDFRQQNMSATLALTMNISLPIEEGQHISFTLVASGRGKYSIHGNSIDITIDPETVSVTAPADKVQSEGLDEGMDQLLAMAFAISMKESVADDMNSSLNDVEINGNKMICTQDGNVRITLRRF